MQMTITPDNVSSIISQLNILSPIEVADLIHSKSVDEGLLIFSQLTPPHAVAAFEYLSFKVQKEVLNHLPSQQVADLLNALSPDDRTLLLEELPSDLVNQLLKYLSPTERALSIKLLGYPEDSVGRLMTPDYLSIKPDWTVRRVLDHIREKGHDSETITVIYAVDDHGILIDDFRIRQFLFASLDTKVSDLFDRKYVALNVTDDREKAINAFRKYDRTALPVIDNKGVLLGIVTFDDIMEVAVEEDTEDIQKIGGVAALKEPYMDISFIQLMRKRIGWLSILFFGEMLTTSAMGHYQDEISRAVVLTFFVPLIISSGGNAGSQASTLIIRAMALEEIALRDWWKIMRREVLSGLFLGTILGVIGFLRVSIWHSFSPADSPHWLLIGMTLFVTLIGVVVWGTFSGAMLPLILKRCGLDPAVSSAPLVATLVDVVGLIIYFSMAMIILKGTLL